MKTTALIAALLFSTTVQAAPSERCYQLAGMYMTAYNLRDAAISDNQRMGALMAFPGLTQQERLTAIERTRPTGDLGFMTARTVYRHALLACAGDAQ